MPIGIQPPDERDDDRREAVVVRHVLGELPHRARTTSPMPAMPAIAPPTSMPIQIMPLRGEAGVARRRLGLARDAHLEADEALRA